MAASSGTVTMRDEHRGYRLLAAGRVPSPQPFQNCVDRYGGGRYLKTLSCWDQYVAMAFAQLTYRKSLRNIGACLGSIGGKLYHMGFRGKIARSTLADANQAREW